MKKHRFVFILLPILLIVIIVITLSLYYRGNRNSKLNTTINNFSKNNPQVAIEIKKLTKVLDVLYLFHQFIPSDIPTYYLSIDQNDYARLNNNLPKGDFAFTSQYKKFVPAQFTFQDKTYPAEVRYRGDNSNHWLFDKKSWRIKFDDQFENQKSINLILPEDRYYFIEPWVGYMGQKLGLTTPKQSLVNLFVNNQRHGVYLKSEHWGEQFLINHNLPENANLYGEAEFDTQVTNLYSDINNFKKFTFDNNQPESDESDLKALLDLLNQASDEVFYNQIENLIDMENFFNWQAQSTLAFSHSQKISHNLVIYHHPQLNKFQFFPWNVAMADQPPEYPDNNYNPLMTRILKNPDYMFQRNQILWQYVKNQDNLDDDLDYFDQLYRSARGSFYQDFLKINPSLDFDLTVRKHRQRILKAQEKMRTLLNDAQADVDLKLITPNQFELTITSHGFSSIKIDSIDPLPNKIVDNQGQTTSYQDILVHTNRDVQEIGQPFLLIPSKKQFQLIYNPENQPNQINIGLRNAITGKIIAPQ